MAPVRYRSIDEIKETLQNAKSRGRGCTLLIGAGCSVKAGIPTAAGFVDIIREQYPYAYRRAAEKTYAKCMAELLLSERRDLIGRCVDEARINWAHLCIALLMQSGYVDRVLTTNFDPLVARAGAVIGVFPAIYDFATSQLLKRADIPGQAVFYLHGQRTGFVLMNTDEDMAKHSTLLGQVFEDAGSGRVWLVVGYSGETDPVFDHLARVPRFDNGLFWIGYGDREPARHVREQLVGQDKDAFFTKGFDADSFFVALTRQLGIFPPDLVARPFSYLKRALSSITPFVEPGDASGSLGDDVSIMPLTWIHNAIAQFEQPTWELVTRGGTPPAAARERAALHAVATQYLIMAGRYEQPLAFRQEYDASPSPELANMLSIAYVMHGNALLDRAKANTGVEAHRLFAEAREMYEAALEVKPDRHEALHNWGNLLLEQAKIEKEPEVGALFAEAEKKYHSALELAPQRFDVLINWGNLLLERAKAPGPGESADDLFRAAEDKYRTAISIKPGLPSVLVNWGNLLLDRAKAATGSEADRLFAEAEQKYTAAIAADPEMSSAYSHWGNVLLDRAKRSRGDAADRLFAAAEDKYAAALAIRPEAYQVLANWGNLLLDRAKTRTGQEADELFAGAERKYQAALAIRPSAVDVRLNWLNLLTDWGLTKTGEEAREIRARAEALEQALRGAPGPGGG
jgi:Tfp pilus assembly protein PilF